MHKKHILPVVMAGLFILMSSFSFAQENTAENHQQEERAHRKEEMHEVIHHHLRDAYYFDLFSIESTGKHVGFPLPVILIDNGLHIFSSARFNRGKSVAEVDGQHYKLYHSKVFKTDASGTLHFGEDGFPTNAQPIDISITKGVVVIALVCLVLFLVFRGMAKSYKKGDGLPKGFNRLLEPMVVYVRDEMAKPTIGPEYKRFMSYLLTVFFFILVMNLLGMLPFGVNITGNITITFTLAIITFFITQFSGNKHYWGHVFWFPNVPVIVKIILIPIEILGLFTKPFALMMRLFANMTAGHVVTLTFLGLIVLYNTWVAGVGSFAFTIFINLIEILVAFIQAYVFTLLSALYFGDAVVKHEEEHEENELAVA